MNRLQVIKSGGATRLVYLDVLRATLAVLVVVHHVSLVYGAYTPFYYVEPPMSRGLLIFGLANQSWFMGCFFLLAGYFTPGSFDRKGPVSFLKEKSLRLGVPLLIYIFVLDPIAKIGTYMMPTRLTGITSGPTWQDYPNLLGLGPLWFIALLLIFTFGYAAWRLLRGNRAPEGASRPSRLRITGICIFILALAAASYLLRIVIPIGKEVFGFPSLAYLPQYLSFFVLGAVAARRTWIEALPRRTGLIGISCAALATLLLLPPAFSSRAFSMSLTTALGNAMGHGHWQSAIYAAWDSIFAVGMCLGLVSLFQRRLNVKRRIGTFMSGQSYAVYVIHMPIVVFLAYLIRGIDLGSVLKCGLASLIAVPVCFAVAYLIRRIPGVTKIL